MIIPTIDPNAAAWCEPHAVPLDMCGCEPVKPVEPVMPVTFGTPNQTGLALLNDVRAWLDRFICTVEPADLDLLTLWAVHTHFAEVTYTTPRLLIDSPVPGSGKTTVLEHLARLCLRPVQAASLSSPALLARLLTSGIRTLLIDEADRALSKDGPMTVELLAVLNSGYKKGGTRPVLEPSKGGGWEVAEMSTYSPVAMAGNNPLLPDDTASRSIRILLLPDYDGVIEDSDWEILEDEAAVLGQRIAAWALAAESEVRHRPALPEAVRGRSRERWAPLKRVALAAGGRWPDAVDQLALKDLEQLVRMKEEGLAMEKPHIVLIKDLSKLFRGETFVPTEEIVSTLVMTNPSVWGPESPYGRALTAQRLGKMLNTHFGVMSSRLTGSSPRGYTKASLNPMLSRFAPHPENEPAQPALLAQPEQEKQAS